MALIRNSFRLLNVCGNIKKNCLIVPHCTIKRWVAPTLKELKKRRQKLGPQPETHRSSFIEWNYNAELFAFGKRLNEEFNIDILRQAFTSRSFVIQEKLKQEEVGIDATDFSLQDNVDLIKNGNRIIDEYIQSYLKQSLPKLPNEGINCIHRWLTSEDNLSEVASHIGIKDLVLSSNLPVDKGTLSDTLKAVIAALSESSGTEKTVIFIRDFICTQLNQQDLTEIWNIEEPVKLLTEICKDIKIDKPEPRIIGVLGQNTILAAYHVGMYSHKKLIGKGFGESVEIAINAAALNALRDIFDIQEHMKPFNFQTNIAKSKIRVKLQRLIQ